MPRWWWRLLAGVVAVTAGYAALKRDGTLCHDLIRTELRTHTRGGRLLFTVVLALFWRHIVRWPTDRPHPDTRRNR